MVARVEVTGLRELNAGLRQLGDGSHRRTRLALNRAMQPIIGAVRSSLPSRSGALASSVKAGSTQSSARIRIGNQRTPYAGWIEFGGKRSTRGPSRSVDSSRPFFPAGRYAGPTVSAHVEHIAQAIGDELQAFVEDVL